MVIRLTQCCKQHQLVLSYSVSGTEHVAKFSMSGTIDWKSLFVLQEQRNERELLQIWVDTFTSWIQRLQHKNYLSSWLKGIDCPSKTDKSN